jgi:bacterioferritin
MGLARGEMDDAQSLIRHILYLEGIPNMQRLNTVNVGENVLENLQVDLEGEKFAVSTLAQAIAHCAEVGDYTTRGMLEAMIRDEEEHVDWFETQLETIRQIGIENYLTEQVD